MGALENVLFHLFAVPAVFLLGRLSAVKVTGFRVKSTPFPSGHGKEKDAVRS